MVYAGLEAAIGGLDGCAVVDAMVPLAGGIVGGPVDNYLG